MGGQPAGGHDDTALKSSTEPTYTVKITFHSATNVPVADMGSRSATPYVLAQINSSVPTRHPEDPKIRFRTKTLQRTTEPVWDAPWIVAGVPESGFTLKARLNDEDSDDHDDRLGRVHIDSGRLSEGYSTKEEYKVKRTGASVRAYTLRWCSTLVHRRQTHARLLISIEVLGRTKEEVGKIYTINNFWWVHYSPMIGRLAGTKEKEGGAEKFE